MNPSIELSIIRANSASVAIEYAGDDLCHAFGNGIAEQIVQVLKGKAQQAQKRLASLAVARSAQDMDPAEQQQAFIIRQDRAVRCLLQQGPQFQARMPRFSACKFQRLNLAASVATAWR